MEVRTTFRPKDRAEWRTWLQEHHRSEPVTWEHFLAFPELYRRIRIGYIDEVRKNSPEFERRLKNFVEKTRQNKMFGMWTDRGRLLVHR